MTTLVLSLFPGIGLLDLAFEQEGFCVVRGPDLLWGGDIRRFHPPARRFDGVIGGPPCQAFSPLVHMVRRNGHEPRHGNLIPEFERVVAAAQPQWFVMENSPFAPEPSVPGYAVHAQRLNNRWLGEEQNRERRLSFGTADGRRLPIATAALECTARVPTVTSKAYEVSIALNGAGKPRRAASSSVGWAESARRLTISEMLRRQGFPPDLLDECPFTMEAKRQTVGNGVPLPMGRAIARAVRDTIYPATAEALA